ncbi:MAG: acid phosphatase, partial [Spirochaetae bacterium HGW-Spirochaetae-9]
MKTDATELRILLENPIFLSAFFSLLIAQFIKAVIALIKARRSEDLREAMFTFFWRTGGMPSSHSAVAISISAAVALTEGFSNLFIVSLFLSLIVIRDALGVRRSA